MTGRLISYIFGGGDRASFLLGFGNPRNNRNIDVILPTLFLRSRSRANRCLVTISRDVLLADGEESFINPRKFWVSAESRLKLTRDCHYTVAYQEAIVRVISRLHQLSRFLLFLSPRRWTEHQNGCSIQAQDESTQGEKP